MLTLKRFFNTTFSQMFSDELEEKVKETNEALLESQVMVKKLQGNQIALEQERLERQALEQEIQEERQKRQEERQKRQALEQIQQALEQERRERHEIQQALDQERQERQALEQELQRMKEREEDQLEEEVRYMLKRVMCKICLEKEVEVLFLPCKHLVSCQSCKERLAQKKCPFCRDTYQATIRVYLA